MVQEEAERKLLATGRIKKFIRWDTPDGKYHGVKSLFVAICENNHTVHKSYAALKRKGCKKCGIDQRALKRTIPHEEAEHRLMDMGNIKKVTGWKTESGSYEGKDSKFTAVCNNGHEFTQDYTSHVNSGHKCSKCSNCYSPTNEEAIENINNGPRDVKFIKWLTDTGKYQNDSSRFLAACSWNHEWSPTYDSIVHAQSGCSHCAGNIKRTTIQAISELYEQGIIKKVIDWKTSSGKYERANSEFIALCKNGHQFTQTFTWHISGGQCSICDDNVPITTEKARENIIKEGRVFGSIRWLTESGGYENNTSKFLAKCEKSHTVSQSYASYMKGHGCDTCGNISTGLKKRTPTEEVMSKLLSTGNIAEFKGWLTPSNAYEGKDSKFSALCPQGHKFTQSYNNHIKGHMGCGCADAGFNVNKPANLYIASQFAEDREIKLKFGITNGDPINRIRRQELKSIYQHRLLNYIKFNTGSEALSLELKLKHSLKTNAANKEDMPDGWTETFYINELPKFLEIVKKEYNGNWHKPPVLFEGICIG